jgi:hypothetical protein
LVIRNAAEDRLTRPAGVHRIASLMLSEGGLS